MTSEASYEMERASTLRARVTSGGACCAVRRALDPEVAEAASFLAQCCFPAFEGDLRPGVNLLQHATPFLTAARRDGLAAELLAATRAFREVARTPSPRVVFGVVDTDSCRKFHVDYIALRMVVTLHGPGTEWVAERDVDRDALARLIEDPDEANKSIVRDPSRIQRCSPGDWLFMKGEAWPGQAGAGAVHRSPPIERERRRRVVLVLTLPRSRAHAHVASRLDTALGSPPATRARRDLANVLDRKEPT